MPSPHELTFDQMVRDAFNGHVKPAQAELLMRLARLHHNPHLNTAGPGTAHAGIEGGNRRIMGIKHMQQYAFNNLSLTGNPSRFIERIIGPVDGLDAECKMESMSTRALPEGMVRLYDPRMHDYLKSTVVDDRDMPERNAMDYIKADFSTTPVPMRKLLEDAGWRSNDEGAWWHLDIRGEVHTLDHAVKRQLLKWYELRACFPMMLSLVENGWLPHGSNDWGNDKHGGLCTIAAYLTMQRDRIPA